MRLKKYTDSLIDDRTEITTILARDQKKFKQKFEVLKLTPDFQKGINEIRKKWGVDFENPHLIETDINDQKEFQEFLKKFGLTKEWGYLISCYIIDNNFEKMGDPRGIQIVVDPKKGFANIKVYPETTIDEIKRAYKIIKRDLKDGKIIKTTTAKNSDRDIFITELKDKGKSYKEIRKIIGDEYNDFLDDHHLGRIIYKIKQRRQRI